MYKVVLLQSHIKNNIQSYMKNHLQSYIKNNVTVLYQERFACSKSAVLRCGGLGECSLALRRARRVQSCVAAGSASAVLRSACSESAVLRKVCLNSAVLREACSANAVVRVRRARRVLSCVRRALRVMSCVRRALRVMSCVRRARLVLSCVWRTRRMLSCVRRARLVLSCVWRTRLVLSCVRRARLVLSCVWRTRRMLSCVRPARRVLSCVTAGSAAINDKLVAASEGGRRGVQRLWLGDSSPPVRRILQRPRTVGRVGFCREEPCTFLDIMYNLTVSRMEFLCCFHDRNYFILPLSPIAAVVSQRINQSC